MAVMVERPFKKKNLSGRTYRTSLPCMSWVINAYCCKWYLVELKDLWVAQMLYLILATLEHYMLDTEPFFVLL